MYSTGRRADLFHRIKYGRQAGPKVSARRATRRPDRRIGEANSPGSPKFRAETSAKRSGRRLLSGKTRSSRPASRGRRRRTSALASDETCQIDQLPWHVGGEKRRPRSEVDSLQTVILQGVEPGVIREFCAWAFPPEPQPLTPPPDRPDPRSPVASSPAPSPPEPSGGLWTVSSGRLTALASTSSTPRSRRLGR